MKELKRANYENNTAIILAGRDVLCLNEDVKLLGNLTAKNEACRTKTSDKCKQSEKCIYYKEEKEILASSCFKDETVLDVEDLIYYGEKKLICPYFASKALMKERSQVIFLPYNYLIDPKIRNAQKISFNDDVIIFDEGHNIEKTCEDSYSIDLQADSLSNCSDVMVKIYQRAVEKQMLEDYLLLDSGEPARVEDLFCLKQMFDGLDTLINEKIDEFIKSGKVYGEVCENDWIFQVLSKCNLNLANAKRAVGICDNLRPFFSWNAVAASAMNNFKDFIELLFPSHNSMEVEAFHEEFKQKFRVYIEIGSDDDDEHKPSTPVKKSRSNEKQRPDGRWWILHIWCLSPSVAIRSLTKKNVRSLLLTSGTLAPLESFEAEFETEFKYKIQNPHVIKPSQMAIFPVSESGRGIKLDSTYSNKKNLNYYKAMGDTIVDLCKYVPDGVLVFFQSYSVMNNAKTYWKDNERDWKIWSKLNELKPVFQEVKNKEQFTIEINSYRDCVRRGKGAAFFAICRGKLSEGIDLGDVNSRAVILVGLPYPSIQDPRVKLKKSYLDTVKHKNFTSNVWYALQMKRALNQAIGRAIRHRADYGCVFLLDYRFQNQTQDLSRWCRDFVRDPVNYGDMISQVEKFYENNRLDELNRRAVASSSNLDDEQIDQNNIRPEVDSSLPECQVNKRKINLSPEDSSKKAKQSNEVRTVCDLLAPIDTIAEEEEVKPKEERKHITIEYDTVQSIY